MKYVKVLRILPLVLIAAGLIGRVVTGEKKNDITRALVVLKSCQIEEIKQVKDGPACTVAYKWEKTPDHINNLKLLIDYYNARLK